jgi:hypothetical protein
MESDMPIELVAARLWSGTKWHYPNAERMVEENKRLRAELAALKAQSDLINDAANEACGELPDGWKVSIDLERGAATVWVFDAEGESEMVHEDETSVSDLVREAIRRAKEGR